jgi:hypothetical protein
MYAQSVPLTDDFQVWEEFGMYIGFGTDDALPIIEFPEVLTINDKNNFLRNHVFREKKLYAFILNEFADFDWDELLDDWYEYNENIGTAAEIFNKAIDIYVEYNCIYNANEERNAIVGNNIALIHYYRESRFLVGIIKSAENLTTRFDKPLTIDASQVLFGRPYYYIVQRNNDTRNGIVITVYNFSKKKLFLMFKKGVLQGICLLS